MNIGAIALALILTLATPLVGSRRWFPHNAFGSLVLALCGAATPLLLRLANIPPKWFDGSGWGFVIGLTLIASAFAFRTSEERFYRLPWLLAFGATILVLNVWAKVA